jgi:hypothetical protein
MFNRRGSKSYVIDSLLKILKTSAENTKNKKNKQKINLCYKLLLKVVSNEYNDITKTKDLEEYLLELNNRKQQQKRKIELFSTILSQYILYAQD